MSKMSNLLALACFVVAPASVNAALITYEFTGNVASASSGRPPDLEPLKVPEPFVLANWPRDLSVTGTFTLQTDVTASDLYYLHDGAVTPVGKSYANAVPGFSISLLGQSVNPNGNSLASESSVDVIDIPGPLFDPISNYDRYRINSGTYAGLWGADFQTLLTSVQISAMHQDLGIITDTALLQDLSDWDLQLSFILSEPETSRIYQLHVPIDSVTPVPEPGTWSLMLAVVVSTLIAARRRGSATATTTQ